MLEIMTIASLVVIGLAVLTLFAVVCFFLKLTLKVVLFPLWLLGGLLKALLFAVGIVLLIAFAPIALVLLVVAIPFLLLAGLFGAGWAIVT